MKRNEAFPVLSNFAGIMGNVGWVLLVAGGVGGFIGIFLLLMDGVSITKGMLAVAGILIGAVGMTMIVLGEMVGVFFAIENNGAELLQLERLADRNRPITGEDEAT